MDSIIKPKMAVLFDFDGTICDSFRGEIIKVFYAKLPKRIKAIFPFELLQNYRNESISNMIRKAKINKLDMIVIAYKFRRLFSQLLDQFEPVAGMREALTKIKETGAQLFIVTSNKASNIEKFLEKNDLKLFDHVSSEYKLNKKHVKISRIIEKYKLDKSNTFYVGDEVRDIEAAADSGIKSVSVTWGMNSKELLLKHKPSYIVDTPEELAKIFIL